MRGKSTSNDPQSHGGRTVLVRYALILQPSPPTTLRFRVDYPIICPVQLSVTQLTERLVASYARDGGINHLDGKNLPSKRAIADITVDLLRLLFPGFFDEKLIHSSEIKVETATLLDKVLGDLQDEIRKSLEYNPPPELPKKDLL